jgi:hypothetical protein
MVSEKESSEHGSVLMDASRSAAKRLAETAERGFRRGLGILGRAPPRPGKEKSATMGK